MRLFLFFFLAALPAKESLTYDVHLGPLHAGEMELFAEEVEFEGKPCYRFRSVLSSLEGLSWLFTLNDTLYSYVTKDSFKVLYFEKHMHETNYDTLIKVRYDWDKGAIIYGDGSEYPLAPGTLDIVSIYYFFRLNPLKQGEQRRVILHADRVTETAVVTAEKETKVRSQAAEDGSFTCTRLVPEVEDKEGFGPQGNLIIYVSKDQNLYPVLIQTRMRLGSITARLKWIWHP